jgi:hypothetical protein
MPASRKAKKPFFRGFSSVRFTPLPFGDADAAHYVFFDSMRSA